ncbi:MAG TPA: L,D-transpeptidase [Marmoricola sp.]|nr:L,D-transpeptidase [Marmoricola sp.]
MHSTHRRLNLVGVIAALATAIAIALPSAPASAATNWHPTSTPRWVVKACRTGTAICIDKSIHRLAYVKNGKTLLLLDARFGDAAHPTREGTFSVYYKDATHVSHEYGSSMPYSMFFSGGEAIHFSIDFFTYGYAHNSHGCVNIRDYNGVKWLFNHTPIGTKVVIYH